MNCNLLSYMIIFIDFFNIKGLIFSYFSVEKLIIKEKYEFFDID